MEDVVKCVSTNQDHLNANVTMVMSLVKTGPDRAELAYTLWTCCGLTAILYGAEVMPLTQATITEVDRCQAQVGKFMLQLPRSSASVAANIDAGQLLLTRYSPMPIQ